MLRGSGRFGMVSLTMAPSYVEVSFPIPLNKTFHYEADGGAIGCRVLAPFGPSKNLVGYVVGRTNTKPSFPTKPILRWLDEQPFLDDSLIALARWVSDRYLCSLGEALACIVPPALEAAKRPLKTQGAALTVQKEDEGDRPSLTLTREQDQALAPLLEAVQAGKAKSFLIRGITDSGKTEVYLRAINQTLALGKQALFLLPEIALTPPFIEHLRSRYGPDRVGLWHSGISPGERYRTWSAVRKGEMSILLGARSAVFAPFPNLGLIVVDEEHESSYKQEERPRYHTREVALKRSELSQAVVVLGSATPSIESYWNAKQGVHTLLEMTSRVEQRSLPVVELVDQRPPPAETPAPEPKRSRASPLAVFSEPLKLAIEQRLARREQVMLFVNRRGFTPFLRCGKCGWVSRCTRCSTTMTLHLDAEERRYMQCHACSRRDPFPVQCPACGSMRLHQFGTGTQKVEEEIKKLFPFVKVARLDRDIASQRRAYERVYQAFLNGELDVLVGTQMIAKGFNFPHVTLVGVIDADVSLHLPDFRSGERTFDLLTQVAGRTGRGAMKGKVLVQTHHPEHYALQAAQEHDYVRFYDQELQARQTLNYPPFCRLVNIVLRGAKEPALRESSEKLADLLNDKMMGIEVLGPSPAPYSRLRNQFRYQILLKGTEASLIPCLQFLRTYRPSKAFMAVDVDPVDLL